MEGATGGGREHREAVAVTQVRGSGRLDQKPCDAGYVFKSKSAAFIDWMGQQKGKSRTQRYLAFSFAEIRVNGRGGVENNSLFWSEVGNTCW